MKITKVCLYCGKEFEALKLITKYCSPQCNKKHYKLRIKKGALKANTQNELAIKNELFKDRTLLNLKTHLTIKETCHLLGFSRSTIYRLVKTEKLKVIKIGKRVIIHKKDIEDLVNSHTQIEIPDRVQVIRQNFNLTNYFYIGEIINKYGISEKGLYSLLIQNDIEKIQIGIYTYVLKTDIENLLGTL